MSDSKPVISIKIVPRRMDTDPGLTVYEVNVSNLTSEWKETFGTLDGVRAFVRGVKAGTSFFGYFMLGIVNDDNLQVE
jgi:hypothetical protein